VVARVFFLVVGWLQATLHNLRYNSHLLCKQCEVSCVEIVFYLRLEVVLIAEKWACFKKTIIIYEICEMILTF